MMRCGRVWILAGALLSLAAAVWSADSEVEELSRTIHAHPTMAEAMGEAAHAALGGAIHL